MAARRARTHPDLSPGGETGLSSTGRGGTAAGPPLTVTFLGHRGVGKTELVEALLERGRVVREAGTVAEGTTLLDCDAESRTHRQTLDLGVAWFEWAGRVVQVLDTPGATFGAYTRELALSASDLAVVVLDGSAGVQHGTRAALATAARLAVPAVVVVAKADRTTTLPELGPEDAHGRAAVWLQLPFEDDHGRLCGIVDVIGRRVLRFADDRSGAFSPEPLPFEWEARVAVARERLCEAVASTDDAVLEHYLEFLDLDDETLTRGLVAAVRANQVVPVVVSAAGLRIGIGELLDLVTLVGPPFTARPPPVSGEDGEACALDPNGPVVAQVLSAHVDEDGAQYHVLKIWSGQEARGDWVDSTGRRHRPRKFYRIRGPRRAVAPDLRPGAIVATWDLDDVPVGATLTGGPRVRIRAPAPLSAMATLEVAPLAAHQREAVERALAHLVHADPALSLEPAAGAGGWLLSGHDDDHLRVGLERFSRWSGLGLTSRLPSIGFVEAPVGPVADAEGVFLETDADGLPGAYGRCAVDLSPSDPGAGVAFEDALGDDEDDLPRRFRRPVEEGVRLAAASGPKAGHPVIGATFALRAGAYDMLVSTEAHLRLAAERAAKVALERAGTRILEPWRQLEVRAPGGTLGELIADLTAHRGRILGLHMDGPDVVLSAEAPYRELRTYGARLGSITSGRGHFRLSATRYEPAPDWVVRDGDGARPSKERSGAAADPPGACVVSSLRPAAGSSGSSAGRRAAGR